MTAIEKQIDTILRKARTALGALSLQAIRIEKDGGNAKDIRDKMFLILALVNVATDPLKTVAADNRLWLAMEIAAAANLNGYAVCKGSSWVKTYELKTDAPSSGISFPISGTKVIVYVNGASLTVQQAITQLYANQTARYIKISGGTI